ncbi:MAG: hypothetical protein C0448_16175, partial [Sphingobacteriaceae bacterium]|nr:hypothetical protein [Sphingobacteriaceae bacterium]
TAVVQVTSPATALNLSTSGDQIFAFNTANIPSSSNLSGFITAINMDGVWVTTGNSSNNTAKPSVFTDGLNSFYLSTERDNAVYNCSTIIGTATQLRAAIYNEVNWNSNDTTLYGTATCSFTLGIGKDDITGFSLYPNPVKGSKVFISSANNYAERQTV